MKLCYVVLCIGFIIGNCGAQSSSSTQSGKPEGLIVYGTNFAFGVKEPQSWRANTQEVASKYHVNIVFLPSAKDAQEHDVTIRVRVNKKVDENTVEDLNYDMQQYKKDYPAARFARLETKHPEYKTFAKLVFEENRFYEYVAYLNPGPNSQFVFSVALSKKVAPATDSEMKAFAEVLQSLQWMTDSVQVKP